MAKFLEQLGYGTPFIYAAATYLFFAWLDSNASDEAKAALASTMTFEHIGNPQIASSLIEIFDRLYTYPLLHWRAFFRSLAFTVVVSTVFAFETWGWAFWNKDPNHDLWIILGVNLLTDYVSLFLIRKVLKESGARPVFALTLGAAIGSVIVTMGNFLRSLHWALPFAILDPTVQSYLYYVWFFFEAFATFSLPAIVVFAWLPLLALGILVLRLLIPLTWIVGKAQWALKDGYEHPLRAVGYVAGIVVFVVSVAATKF